MNVVLLSGDGTIYLASLSLLLHVDDDDDDKKNNLILFLSKKMSGKKTKETSQLCKLTFSSSPYSRLPTFFLSCLPTDYISLVTYIYIVS